MKLTLGRCVSAIGLVASAGAQPLSVYSEFARINASGEVTAPETPREILSPALVRNGFTSFQIVVQAPADAKWWLFVGQNPENAVKVTMYRESGEALEAVELPRQGVGTEVLWMDLWTAADAPVGRIKIEPELHLNDDWVTYPVEARVMEAVAPDIPATPLGVVDLGGDCGVIFDRGNPSSLTGRRWRNFEQDLLLAQAHSAMDEVKKRNNSCNLETPKDPERYLRIRDYLYGLR